MPHRERARHQREYPVLVTVRIMSRSLRSQYVFPTVRNAIAATNRKRPTAFRICEFSVQSNHLHLLVEATDARALSQGMRSLGARLAYHINRLLFRRGQLIAARFHSRDLETPRAVRNALIYIFGNFRKHSKFKNSTTGALLDVYSSAPYFRSFRSLVGIVPRDRIPNLIPRALAPPSEPPVCTAQTSLLSESWISLGYISMNDAPRT